jgi:hypothetical protein
MFICSKCEEEKEKRYRNNSSYCMDCRNKQVREWYAESNKTKHLESVKKRNKKYIKELSDFISKTKNKPCVDCNEIYPPYVMDFHHLDPSKKDFIISFLVSRKYSIKRIKQEIDKCIVLCSNCHRIRHHK